MSGVDAAEPGPGASEQADPAPRLGPHRRLYAWVLHWANTPWGAPALFALALAESSFFPVPPDPLLMALCLGRIRSSLRFAAIATAASVVGGVIGYAIGAAGWSLMQDWFFTYVPGVDADVFERVRALYDRYDFWAVFLAGLTPIPYKVFTLSAGVFAINFWIFVLASCLSRGLRFFLVAGLIRRFGPWMAAFIDRYFDALALAFGVLLILGFVVVRLVM